MLLQDFKNVYHGAHAFLAAVRYGFPTEKIKVIGITGTDGKTTTTHLIHHLLKSAGIKASMVSSVYAEIGGKQYDTGFHVTTPDSWMLQKFLRDASDAGDEYMVVEVTSHGLDQNRVAFINFLMGVLTNITHEHLDYHKTYENYVQAKKLLLKRAQVAIVNYDDESYAYLKKDDLNKLITYSLKNQDASVTPKKFPFTTPLPGEYNQYNCLAALSVAQEIGISAKVIRKALETFPGVKGRFEKIPNNYGFSVIIDFAHTPNSFAEVLPTVKSETKGRLIHVFGCAALRDTTKRPIMGKISAHFADIVILTEEDYRTEDVHKIIDEIAQGCLKTGAQEVTDFAKLKEKSKKTVFVRVPNRQKAIDLAISIIQKGDTLLMTGKAHETSLCRGTKEYPWSEYRAVEKALRDRK